MISSAPIAQPSQRIAAQPGPQRIFLSSPADIAIYGGAAGGGKSFALLLEPLRWTSRFPAFKALTFRRTMVQVRSPGGLWDESEQLYPLVGGNGSSHSLMWRFPNGSTCRFTHMEHEKNRFDWQGSQIPLISFDELTHFTERQFFYMLSRNRSTCGVRPYIRAATNPDPDSWVAEFISWWIDQDTGYAIKERGGKIRWMIRISDEILWSDDPAELKRKHPKAIPKSVTFVPALVEDNAILMAKDPGYMSNLLSLPLVEREQLLKGNWKIRPKAGLYFQKTWFKLIDRDAIPLHNRTVRYWDRAATEQKDANDPDWTVGLRISRDQFGMFYVEDIIRLRGTPATVQRTITSTAEHDGPKVEQWLEQDPGQAGVYEVDSYIRQMAKFCVRSMTASGDKVLRAGPASSQAEHGKISVVRAPWNQAFFDELEAFPTEGVHDDQVDGLSGGVRVLADVASMPVPVGTPDHWMEVNADRRNRSLAG